jgi:capsular exopolysaccharide synthesis family protein
MSEQHSRKRPSETNGSLHRKNGSYRGEYYNSEPFPNSPVETDEIDLKYLFSVLLRYKYWALGIIFITTALAVSYAYTLPPVYESSGTVLIQEDRTSQAFAGNSDLNSILSTSFGVGAGSRIGNEIEVMQSRKVAEEIAQRLFDNPRMENGEVLPILWYNYPEDSTRASSDAVAGRIQNRMQVQRTDQETDIISITYSSPSPFEVARLVNTTIEAYSDVSAQQKRAAASAALEFLGEEREKAQADLRESEEQLREYMSRTNLVQVDGQTQAAIDRLAELESQRQQVQVERVSVNSSIDSYENQLEQIRPGLAEQLSENISGQLSRAQFRLAELRTERDLLVQRNPSLRSNPEQEPQYASLVEEIETVRNQIRDITSNVLNADDSDVYIGFLDEEDGGVTQRIIELRRNLIELKIQQSQLDAQQDVLEERIAEENAFLDDLPDNMIDLARLQRDTQVNEELFSAISEQYTQTQLWEQTQYGSGRTIDAGQVPDTPAGPNRKLIALIGFMIGGVISVGFVVGKETYNRAVDGSEKLRKIGYPVLATIPDIGPYVQKRFNGEARIETEGRQVSTSWSMLIDSISPLSESYRRLHNNVIYADPDRTFQTIIVTSPKKSEGKSTVSMNLAVALAESGKKVVILDCDLRRPALHGLMGESREPGLVELFYDDEKTSSVIKPTAAPGVHIITSGRRINNPAAVLKSVKMRELIEELKNRYDHVIIDTPPYGVIADAAAIMKQSDGIVLATRFKFTKLNELFHTIENLNRIKANIIGFVITEYKHAKSADYYYYDYTYDSYQAYDEYQEKA